MTTLLFLKTLLIASLPLLPNHFNSTLSHGYTKLDTLQPALPAAERGKVTKDRENANGEFRLKTVIIDPGHGGHDPGCLGSDSQEKHIALAIAKQLARVMSERYPGLNVILTRDQDVFVPLHERARIANRSGADLFISIHCNFMPNSERTSGSETYVMGLHTAEHNLEVAKRENAVILLEDNYERHYDYDPNSPEGHILLSMFQNAYLEQSILFAERVEARLHSHAQRRSRGVKQAGFVVLKETAMPSVLIETGFLSNRDEEGYLKTEEGQQQVAGAIIGAFHEYKTIIEGDDVAAQPAAPPVAPARPVAVADPFQGPATPPPAATTPAPVAASTPTNFGTRVPATAAPTPPPPTRAAAPADNELQPRQGTDEAAAISFAVQLAASPRPLDTSDSRWRDIRYTVEVVEESNLLKYQARNFPTLHQAMDARFYLRNKGFTDAFIIAYRNGQRISLEEARKMLGE